VHPKKTPQHNPEEPQTLDLDSSYPCPSCKQGWLIPITLTEAWGCDRCKQIFELKAQPNTIGKLTTPYPRQRLWKWNGKHWVLSKSTLQSALGETPIGNSILLLPILLGIGWSVLTLIGLSIAIRTLILVALVVMFWVILRR